MMEEVEKLKEKARELLSEVYVSEKNKLPSLCQRDPKTNIVICVGKKHTGRNITPESLVWIGDNLSLIHI